VSKIDFYVLRASGNAARAQFACRLAEKAYRLQNTVHIQAANVQSAAQLDELLWTFRDGSFVPHEVLNTAGADRNAPVTIGCNTARPAECDLLINLGDSIPESPGSFPRIAEIVTADDDCKAQSRHRFVEYRDDGHTLETHKL
jgi:DNA polymerase-3 subunit chi